MEFVDFVKRLLDYGSYGYLTLIFFILAFLSVVKAVVTPKKVLSKYIAFLIFFALGAASLEHAKNKHLHTRSTLSNVTNYFDLYG